MKSHFLVALLLLGSMAAVPAVTAENSGDAAENCIQYEVANVALVINAGTIRYCARFPTQVSHDDTVFNLQASLTGPVLTLVGGVTFTVTVSAEGCTAGTTVTRNAAVGAFAQTFTTPMTMTSDHCSGKVRVQVVGPAPASIVVFDGEMPYNVIARDTPLEIDNLNRFCAASNFEASCTTPSVNVPDVALALQNLTDALCNNPGGHGHCSLDIHGGLSLEQDGTWTIRVENFTSQVDVGNQSVVFPSNLTVAASFPGDVDAPGFDFWALFLFWVLLLGFLLYQGWYFAAGFAIPGVLDAMFPTQIPENFSVWFVFVLLGAILEIAASKFQWGHYKSRTGMRA